MRKLLALLSLLAVATTASPQAVTLTGAARMKITLNCVANTKRCTGDIAAEPNTAPFWHADGNPAGLIESSVDWLRNSPQSINLNTRCTDPDGDVLVITKESGTVTGVSLTAGVYSGTPTAVEAPTPVFRCSDGGLYDDTGITFNVANAPPSDTTPDAFSFVSQNAVTQSAVITSAAVVITGINAASTVTVSGGTWSKNGGAYGGTSGTVVAGDSVTVRHTSSASLNTVTQTTLTVGGVSAIFSSTTVSSPLRVGVFYTLDFETFSAPVTNPEQSDWPVNSTAAHDGMNPNHLAMDQYGEAPGCNSNCVPANVRALPHFQIVSSNPTPLRGSYAAKATIYPPAYSPDVDYSKGSFQGKDKPRVNFRMQNGIGDFAWRTRYVCAFGIHVPSNYVEETDSGWAEVLIQNHTGVSTPNAWTLKFNGKNGGGSSWRFELDKSNSVDSAAASVVNNYDYDVTVDHKGFWNVFVVEWDADNRSLISGGTPLFKVWHGTYNESTLAVVTPMTLRWNLTDVPFGWSNTGMPTLSSMALNLYKGNWHGETQGAYTGGKTDPIVIDYDEIRCATGAGGYADVHPFQEAQP